MQVLVGRGRTHTGPVHRPAAGGTLLVFVNSVLLSATGDYKMNSGILQLVAVIHDLCVLVGNGLLKKIKKSFW
jgi:hypothetical protein